MTSTFDDLTLLHSRDYDVRTYKVSDTRIKVVGTVHDVKPAGLYIVDDPEPLGIHHMQVVLDVDVSTLTIVDTDVTFSINPHDTCPSIAGHYRLLTGLSVTRGFSAKVRELFGGPRGCSHTTALLLAMGPVVTQSLWSLRVASQREQGLEPFAREDGDSATSLLSNLNTCHIWDEEGDLVAAMERGERHDVPVWIERRFAELGRDVSEWRNEAVPAGSDTFENSDT